MKLIGIVIVIVGLALRWKTGPVVLAAALVTGLVAGLPIIGSPQTPGILDTLGKAFTENRLVTLYLLTLPAVGLAESAGLHRFAADLIRRIRSASLARLLWSYQFTRVLIGAAGIRFNGHAVFGRPIVEPMASGLLENPDEKTADIAKGAVAASENYGNFFGQNLFPAGAGCLLVAGVMKGAGYPVSIVDLAKLAIPIVVVSLVFAAIQFAWIGRKLRKEGRKPDVQ
jgi:uncharacterized membrane protein